MNDRPRPCPALALLPALAVLALAGTSCRKDSTAPGTRAHPNAPALYGEPKGQPSTSIATARVVATNSVAWPSAPFFVLQTELSPATLVHCGTKHLSLFTGTTNDGLAAPTYFAWSTISGPRSFPSGTNVTVTNMMENWVLVWWAGAKGWTNWDSPWVVYLQHRPSALRLDDDGLHLDFPAAAGDVVLLPLYGDEKLPTKDLDYLAAHGLPGRKPKVETWKWEQGLTRDPLTRIRYWAAATRALPVHCEETFSVERAQDSVTIRSRFTWHSIDDDWQTRHLKLAPLSPPLAHVLKVGGFPVRLSRPWFDLEMATPSGPYAAVEGVDEYDATFFVLQYVNETEATDPPDTNAHPSVAAALAKLRGIAHLQEVGGVAQTESWHARALPHCDDGTRTNATANLRNVLRGVLEDHRKPDVSFLESLRAYAHVTGDWPFIRERWPQVKTLFTTPRDTRWSGFGRDGVARTMGEAADCAAFARLAWQVGDLDAYNYGCYLFARELTLAHLRMRGADYFRRTQPRHSMEFMDDEVFLTRLRGDGTGWEMDGPKFPALANERPYENRWAGCNDLDVARFFREHSPEEVRRELNWLQARWSPQRRWESIPNRPPPLVQLRSLLLNETPAKLATIAAPAQFDGSLSGVKASCLAVLRTSRPTRVERLIPGGSPSPFVTGLERELGPPNVTLIGSVEHEVKTPASILAVTVWPQVTWREWQTPTGARWNFGSVQPVREGQPVRVKIEPLNWNTRAVAYPALP